MEKLSIIIPAYNVELYVEKCINSILTQNFQDYRVYVVDDCSTDRTASIVKKFVDLDSRIVYLKTPENSGPSVSRNCGLSISKGEYLTFIDADDWYSEQYSLQKMVSVMDQFQVDCVMCAYETIHNTGTLHKKFCGWYNEKKVSQIEFFKLKEKYNSPLFHYVWNKIYKRDIICNARIEFIPGKNSGEDVAFNNAYFRAVRTAYIVNETLYVYNCLNQSSLTRKNYGGNEKKSPPDIIRNVENRLNTVLNGYYEQKNFYASIGLPKMTCRYLRRNTYLE